MPMPSPKTSDLPRSRVLERSDVLTLGTLGFWRFGSGETSLPGLCLGFETLVASPSGPLFIMPLKYLEGWGLSLKSSNSGEAYE